MSANDNKIPDFAMTPDVHGRYPDALAPSGGTLNVSTSGTSAGGYVPISGDTTRHDRKTRPTIIRLALTKDSRIRFSADGASAADSTDMLFLAGVESFRLPAGYNYINAITEDSSAGKLSLTVMQ